MNDFITYKDYYGSVKYSAEDKVFWGKLEFINDLVTFEAVTVDDLEKAFQESVNDYIETCKQIGREPQKSFKGQFNVRIKPELHKKAARRAAQKNISLNKFVEESITMSLSV